MGKFSCTCWRQVFAQEYIEGIEAEADTSFE
jgi:hypothetical protein